METRNLSENELMPIYYMWNYVEGKNHNVKEDSKKLIIKWSNAHGKTIDIVNIHRTKSLVIYLIWSTNNQRWNNKEPIHIIVYNKTSLFLK